MSRALVDQDRINISYVQSRGTYVLYLSLLSFSCLLVELSSHDLIVISNNQIGGD